MTPGTVGFTIDEIFCCLRVSLFHDSMDVRAAGLRAMRYLLRDEESVESLLRINIEYLICRSLDVMLDNKTERIQGLRLVRKLLSLSPKRFPTCIARCLVAIARDGFQERDALTRSSMATIAELLLLNPTLCAECGAMSAILDSILQGNQSHQISEALIGSVLYLLNSPNCRYLLRADQDLQHFIAPFTDCHFSLPSFAAPKGAQGTENYAETTEQREAKFTAAKNALISVLRSWSGIVYLCRCIPEGRTLNGLQSLIEMLHLPYIETRRHLMELIFELFYLPVPEYVDDFLLALFSSNPSTMQDTWQLHDGFVANEGKAILSHIVKNRQSLLDNYLAILLYAFVYYGVLDGLVSVIIVPNSVHNSVRATILLGELLHLCSQLLPPEIAQRCHSLPKLVEAATSSNSSVEQRNTALSAISNLSRMHVLKKHPIVPCSLYLDQLLQFCTAYKKKKKKVFYASSKAKHRQYLRKENDDETVLGSIKDSQVLIRDHLNWDLTLIASILQWPGDGLRNFEDSIHKNFIKKLLNFYKPTSKPSFSNIDSSDENGREYCVVGCHLIDFLVEADEAKANDFLEEFLLDLTDCFREIVVPNPPSSAALSPTRMFSTFSHAYFLFIGRLSSSVRGAKLLEKVGIYHFLLDLISLSSHEAYMKLIVSSLDYTKDGQFTRTLLAEVLTATSESARLYATNYLRVLLRAKLKDFNKWALELLAQQLSDKSDAVVIAAAEIIDESLDDDTNLESLITLRPSLLHIGDRGILLMTRYFSSKNGFKSLKEQNYLKYEMDRWKQTFNLKYVRIVEDVLNEALTYHHRSEDGTYGRRTDKKNNTKSPSFIPPHFYGQLAKHEEGIQLLSEEHILDTMFNKIREADFSNEFKLIELKASLWAVGHVASTSLGFDLIKDHEIIQFIISLAAQAPVLSLRGVCFYVLGLIGSTSDGADYLKEFGWEAMRHSHNEKWPLVKKTEKSVDYVNYPVGRRNHTFSMSSTTSQNTDFNPKYFSVPEKGFKSVDSFVYDDVQDDESNILYCSLPAFQANKIFRNKKEETSDQQLETNEKLSRVASLSPQHYSVDVETRPRSSSDCQQRNFNEMGADVDDSDASSGLWFRERSNESMPQSGGSSDVDNISSHRSEQHDSGLVCESVVSAHPLSTLKTMSVDKMQSTQSLVNRRKVMMSFSSGVAGPRRKISEPSGLFTYHNSLNPRNERSDSNESSGKSRSGSFADSTSGVSSCESTLTTGAIGQSYFQKLSPIASLSSISNNLSNTALRSAIFPHSTLPRKSSSTGFGSPTDNGTPVSFESIPSAVDASGYATLQAIQRKRVESLGIHYQSFSTEESPQLDGLEDYFNNDYHSETTSLKSLTLLPESDDPNQSVEVSKSNDNKDIQQTETKKQEPEYMGLCLPLSLDFLFVAPVSYSFVYLSFIFILKDDSIFSRTKIDSESDCKTNSAHASLENVLGKVGLELHTDRKCLLCCKMVIQISRATKLNTDTSNIQDDSFSNLVLVRKEVLRFVINLGGSIFAKASEQGLLNLKQKYPQAFQDICLYSEVCLHLSSYNFRLPARRFLQELFLDLTFDQVV
ncbi:rapamycin-insensitive companion of mTOR-like isoform X1 [Leptotrombidium deliense]|uniref:Rapamycin-insensitive companion of mTOR-like isoform X1 n=1 Tax=Leptotrombidium deliense TaxID=299467 RepID=A0A443SFE2_9ACAR|nr:rapamycin-insensitive companion of mTOR-like isoform X1 [Leptotrombidium deliense]